MWGHLFFFFVLRNCMHWLAHSRWPNRLILRDKMASSMRWTVFEPFVPAALAVRLGRRGKLQPDPHLVPSAFTPTRPALDVTHVPQEGMRKPVHVGGRGSEGVRSNYRRSSSSMPIRNRNPAVLIESKLLVANQ